MDENDIRKFDEATTVLIRTLPGALWSFYKALVKEGFSEIQALQLTCEWMKGITKS